MTHKSVSYTHLDVYKRQELIQDIIGVDIYTIDKDTVVNMAFDGVYFDITDIKFAHSVYYFSYYHTTNIFSTVKLHAKFLSNCHIAVNQMCIRDRLMRH